MAKNKINIINNFFSQKTFRQCFEKKDDTVYKEVIRRYINDADGKDNAKLISEIYTVLKKDYRNEYYYKNTLLNKLLLGVHSVNTTTALTEIPISNSKADFVLINGKAVVYEIKTELDNLERVENQINDYYKAFDHVAVVTCMDNVKALQSKIESIGKPVGIYVLQKNGAIKTIAKPEIYKESIDPNIMFQILWKKEFEDIIEKEYGYLPEVSEFKYYSECRKLFVEINIEDSYKSFLRHIKKRAVIEKESFEEIPYELKFLAYFMKLKDKDYKKIDVFLNEVYGGV